MDAIFDCFTRLPVGLGGGARGGEGGSCRLNSILTALSRLIFVTRREGLGGGALGGGGEGDGDSTSGTCEVPVLSIRILRVRLDGLGGGALGGGGDGEGESVGGYMAPGRGISMSRKRSDGKDCIIGIF